MSRIRTLKPEWLDDERLCDCSLAARVLSIGLILLADDYGVGRASPSFLARRVALDGAAEALAELEQIGFVATYTADGQAYYAIRNWAKHQRIDNAGKRILPAPPPSIGTSGDFPGPTLAQPTGEPVPDSPPDSSPRPAATRRDSRLEGIGMDQEGNGEEGSGRAREAPPSPVRQVFEAHVEAWRRAGSNGTEPRLTDARRKLIRDRLKDHPAEALTAAAQGVFVSKYHAESGRTSLEIALANAAVIEELAAKLARAPKPRTAKPKPPTEPAPEPLDVQANAAAAKALTASLAATLGPPK